MLQKRLDVLPLLPMLTADSSAESSVLCSRPTTGAAQGQLQPGAAAQQCCESSTHSLQRSQQCQTAYFTVAAVDRRMKEARLQVSGCADTAAWGVLLLLVGSDEPVSCSCPQQALFGFIVMRAGAAARKPGSDTPQTSMMEPSFNRDNSSTVAACRCCTQTQTQPRTPAGSTSPADHRPGRRQCVCGGGGVRRGRTGRAPTKLTNRRHQGHVALPGRHIGCKRLCLLSEEPWGCEESPGTLRGPDVVELPPLSTARSCGGTRNT
jgi:hypothetical protein